VASAAILAPRPVGRERPPCVRRVSASPAARRVGPRAPAVCPPAQLRSAPLPVGPRAPDSPRAPASQPASARHVSVMRTSGTNVHGPLPRMQIYVVWAIVHEGLVPGVRLTATPGSPGGGPGTRAADRGADRRADGRAAGGGPGRTGAQRGATGPSLSHPETAAPLPVRIVSVMRTSGTNVHGPAPRMQIYVVWSIVHEGLVPRVRLTATPGSPGRTGTRAALGGPAPGQPWADRHPPAPLDPCASVRAPLQISGR